VELELLATVLLGLKTLLGLALLLHLLLHGVHVRVLCALQRELRLLRGKPDHSATTDVGQRALGRTLRKLLGYLGTRLLLDATNEGLRQTRGLLSLCAEMAQNLVVIVLVW